MLFEDSEKLKELRIAEQSETNDATMPLPLSDTGSAPSDALTGATILGHYQIDSEIGAGGMSRVYKAKDPVFDRWVAIKVLSAPTPADKELLRFQQEARSIGSLNHAGIVAVHEFAVSDAGQPYLVMEHVDGKPLSDLIAKQTFIPKDRCVAIALQIIDALGYAHQKGVVHRDLKPSNVMLQSSGDTADSVKILDFGIAKRVDSEIQGLTKTGEVFGTPLYMSPEQCAGNKTDHRSDIYSLGCVLYEMLVGKPPHNGETALSTAIKHMQEEPLKLSSVRSDLQFPGELEAIIWKMLAKDINLRYQSMAEIRSDLERFSAGLRPKALNAQLAETQERPQMNMMLLIAGIALMGMAILVQCAQSLTGHRITDLYEQFVFIFGPGLVGVNLCVASLIFWHSSPVKKPTSFFEWITTESQGLREAGERTDAKLLRAMAMIFIIEILSLGLALLWSRGSLL